MPEGRDRVALGFDFGLKRIGIASGDTVTATAAPCATVRSGAAGPDWATIDQLLQRFAPDVLVVGTPRHADGSLSSLAEAADHFAAQLAERCRLPIVRIDEFASSIEATDALRRSRSAGLRRRRVRHADIDAAAAAIILGRWLSAETKAGKEGVA